MSTLVKVLASVTSPPTNVSLLVNGTPIAMARDGSGNWAGQSTLDLPDAVPIAFRAVGIAFAPWTLEIKFMSLPPNSRVVNDFKHDDQIPAATLISILDETVTLKNMVTT
jgi:hypothetical protein